MTPADHFFDDGLGPIRLMAWGLVVALFVAVVALFLQTTASDDSGDVVVLPDLAVVAEEAVADAPFEPTYLAFQAAFDSRVQVVDRSGSGSDQASVSGVDRAHGSAATVRATAGLDLEADLFPPYSLAGRTSVAPGLYATGFDVEKCSFELRRIDRQGVERVIGQDRVLGGRMLATVHDLEPDIFDPDPSCGQWSAWSPLVVPLEEASSGDYWRSDLRPGRWTVSRGCEWEKVVGFRGADLADVYDSGFGPGTVLIDDETLGLRVRRCPDGLVWATPLPVDEDDES